MDAYLRDIKKLIQYDALPEGTYKELAEISGKIDDAKITLETNVPKVYVTEKLQSIDGNTNIESIIYLSEQFL